MAIIMDGSPEVLLLPAVFWQFLETPEDYYDLPIFAFFVKSLRLVAFFFSVTLPGIYVAVTTFHWGLIPTDLLIRFASSRSVVPYPIILEVLMLEFVFEVLREAGMRFPKNMGQVVRIIGALGKLLFRLDLYRRRRLFSWHLPELHNAHGRSIKRLWRSKAE